MVLVQVLNTLLSKLDRACINRMSETMSSFILLCNQNSSLTAVWVNRFVREAWAKSRWVLLALLSGLQSRVPCCFRINIVAITSNSSIRNHLFGVKGLFEVIL